MALNPGDPIQYTLGVPMGRIHHDHIHFFPCERLNPLIRAIPNTHRRADPQPFLVIPAGKGKVLSLLNILDGDEPPQFKSVVNDQHLFDPVLVQQRHHFLAARPLVHRDQSLLGSHNQGDWIPKPSLEP